jgi:hypothetical protein
MANPWFRMYAEFATDPKVQMLSESDQRRLSMLFCLRCNGHVTLQDEEVTFLLRISNDQWATTKALFVERGFINEGNEVLNWDKRQFASDTSKNRVAAYRERKKNEGNDDVTLPKQESNAVDTDTDTDTDINTNVSNKVANCPYEQIISNFNAALPMLPAVKQLTDKRKKAILARWKEDSKRHSLEWWESFFAYVSKSDFLTGRNGAWSACCFDWIFKSENFVKIIEGNYENKP